MVEEKDPEPERRRIIEDYERRQHEIKEHTTAEQARLMEEFDQEIREVIEREDREWAEFERRRKEKQEKEHEQTIEEEQRLGSAMREGLANIGFIQEQIEVFTEEVKAKGQPFTDRTDTATGSRAPALQRPRVPVYAKIHLDYISTDTLRYYDIPWEYDAASSFFSSVSSCLAS